MTSTADISDVMRQEGSDQEQDAWRLKKYPSLYGDERVTAAEAKGLAEAFGAEDAAKAEEGQ